MSKRTAGNLMILPPETPSNDPALAKRQRDVFVKTVMAVQELVDRLSPDELEDVADALQTTFSETDDPSASKDVASGSDKATSDKRRRITLELDARRRAFRFRRDLLQGALTTSEVAKLLGTPRQTPGDRYRSGAWLGILDRGTIRFPVWQFDPEGPEGVIDGLSDAARVLNVSPLGRISWFVRPTPYFDGRTPLQALKDGEKLQVFEFAQSVGVT